MTATMTKYLDVQKQKSEVVSRLLEIKALEETPELRTERESLTQKQATVETEFRAALLAVTAEQETTVNVEDTADRELRQLTVRASLGDVFAAAVEKRGTTGATHELAGPSQDRAARDSAGHAPGRAPGHHAVADKRGRRRTASR